jgi:hypothetical protein
VGGRELSHVIDDCVHMQDRSEALFAVHTLLLYAICIVAGADIGQG